MSRSVKLTVDFSPSTFEEHIIAAANQACVRFFELSSEVGVQGFGYADIPGRADDGSDGDVRITVKIERVKGLEKYQGASVAARLRKSEKP